MSKKTSTDITSCKVAVEELLRQTNKPYNLQLVIDYTGSKWGKTVVQKVLDTLVEEKKLKFIEIGRGKLYLYDQSNAAVLTDEELARIKLETQAVLEDNQALKSELAKLQKQHAILTAEAKTEKLLEVRRMLELTEKEKNALLSANKGNDSMATEITDKDMDDLKKLYKRTMTMWKDRKERVVEAVELVAEGTEKSAKEVMEGAKFYQDNWKLYKQFAKEIPLKDIHDEGSVSLRQATREEEEPCEADAELNEQQTD